MEEVAYKPAQPYSEKNFTPASTQFQTSFLDYLLKYGQLISRTNSAGGAFGAGDTEQDITIYQVPQGYKFYLLKSTMKTQHSAGTSGLFYSLIASVSPDITLNLCNQSIAIADASSIDTASFSIPPSFNEGVTLHHAYGGISVVGSSNFYITADILGILMPITFI